jgi:hypothetical protein
VAPQLSPLDVLPLRNIAPKKPPRDVELEFKQVRGRRRWDPFRLVLGAWVCNVVSLRECLMTRPVVSAYS